MTIEKLLEQRKKKPTFRRQNTGLKSRLSPGWRRPKGIQSKLRLKRKNRGVYVTPGYKSAKAIRGLSRKGMEMVPVVSVTDLEGLNPKKQSVVLSSNLGFRKKKVIIESALKAGIVIENFKNPQVYVDKKVETTVEEKKVEEPVEEKQKEEVEKKKVLIKKQ